MSKDKSSLSRAKSYKEIGEFWDTHDVADYWDKTKEVKFALDIRAEKTYYAIDKKLSDKIQTLALKRGVSAHTLLNLWLQEKLQEQRLS